jgi:type IV secretory pathway VirB10-like protein
VHKQFRRFDIVVGAVFVVLVIVGLLTVHSGSKPEANSSHTVRATAAAPVPDQATPVHAAGVNAPATRPAPPPTQAAPQPPPPPPPATRAAPAAPAGCTPKTDAGNCYEPGEFCRTGDRGTTGVAGDGKAIKCEDNDGWRWEPV